MPAFPFPTDLITFAVWIGTPAAIGVFLAYGLEKLPFWEELQPGVKSLIVFLLSAVLPYASTYLVHIDPAIYGQVQPVFNFLLQAIVAYVTSQYAHGTNPLRDR